MSMETSPTSVLAKPEPSSPAANRRRLAEWVAPAGAALLLGGATVAALSGSDERRVRLGALNVSSACPFRHLTGRRCPGCGMTRAIALLLRGKLLRATRMNPGVIPALAALVHQLLGPLRLRRSRVAVA